MSQIKIFWMDQQDDANHAFIVESLEKKVNKWLAENESEIDEVVKMYSTTIIGIPVFWIWYE